MASRKPWVKPGITGLELSEEELERLFPGLGEEQRRQLIEREPGAAGLSLKSWLDQCRTSGS